MEKELAERKYTKKYMMCGLKFINHTHFVVTEAIHVLVINTFALV